MEKFLKIHARQTRIDQLFGTLPPGQINDAPERLFPARVLVSEPPFTLGRARVQAPGNIFKIKTLFICENPLVSSVVYLSPKTTF